MLYLVLAALLCAFRAYFSARVQQVFRVHRIARYKSRCGAAHLGTIHVKANALGHVLHMGFGKAGG